MQLWRSGRFALLLTDLHMPRDDGYALAAAVRADERTRGRTRKPVIAISANVSAEEVERSRAAGIDDFLAKPTPLMPSRRDGSTPCGCVACPPACGYRHGGPSWSASTRIFRTRSRAVDNVRFRRSPPCIACFSPPCLP
ncbi:MAG: response regulator [Lysobacterales bacterium]